MNTTFNQAIEEYKNGNIEKSYQTAMRDEGINPSTTLSQWVAFAEKAIARREAEAKMHQEILNS